MKKTLLATAVLSAMVAAAGAQAAEVKISGQVSRAVVIADDSQADSRDAQHVDNNASGSRFRIVVSHDLGNGMTAGARLEEQLQKNKSNTVNSATATNVQVQDLRYADIYFSGSFGKVSMGQGDPASNGTAEEDLSGTTIAAYAGHADLFESYTHGVGSTVVDNYKSFDGRSRSSRLRYDTPNMSGFSAAVSHMHGDDTDFALRYSGDFSGTKFSAAVGLVSDEDDNNDTLSASASLLLGNGLNFTLSYSEQEQVGDDAENLYAKIGYKTGKHALSLDYGITEELGADDSESLGVAYVYNVVSGVELWATYRTYETDVNGDDDVDGFAVGSRVKF